MNNANIVNDIDSFKKTNIVNDIDRATRAERIAGELVQKFGKDDSRQFYLKVAYKLSESKIWSNYEKALKGRNPGGLFNFLCRKDMNRG